MSKTVFRGEYKIYTDKRIAVDKNCQGLLKITLLFFIALTFLSTKSYAESDTFLEFSIPDGELTSLLLEFSEQSGVQLFYRSEISKGVTVRGINGSYTIKQALQKLLADTDLIFEFTDENTISIRLVETERPDTKLSTQTKTTPVEAEQASIEEILVTGSHIYRDKQFYSTSPISLIKQEDMNAQGITITSDIIRNLIINTGAEFQLDALSSTETVGTANINLRGLGLGSTLVLLNNHRQTVSALATQEDGASFVDINSLVPLIMIERVEILKDGAAAIYGTDAVAGVVNFITYKDFEGLKFQGDYQHVTEGNYADAEFSAMYGVKFKHTDIILGGSYRDRSSLKSTDKDFTTGTAISSFGQPGTFLGSSGFVADPNCTSEGGILLNNGFCGFDITPFFHLSPNEEMVNIYSTLNHRLTETIEAKLEAGYVKNDGETIASPAFPFAKFNPIVPVANPGNIFGEDVAFFGRVLGTNAGPSVIEYTHETQRISGELIGRTQTDWTWNIVANHSSNKVEDIRSDTLADRLVAALNGLGGPNNDQFFNPLGGAINSEAVLNDIIARATINAESSLSTVEAILSGSLWALADDNIEMAVGTQFRHEELDVDFGEFKNADRFLSVPGGDDFSASRNVGAVFVEFDIPIHSKLDIQTAARYENYGEGLDSIDPMVAMTWRPLSSMAIRGSYGTSFRAPSLLQTTGLSGSNRIINDPLLGINNAFRTVTTFGSNELRPEEAKVFNAGLTYSPSSKLQIDIDYWRYDYNDVVTKENPQDIIDQAFRDTQAGLTGTDAQNKVIRDPVTASISSLTTDFINAASILTDGIDLSVNYLIEEWLQGQLSLQTQWSFINRYDIKQTPNSPTIDAVGNRNSTNFARTVIKWRGNTSLQWQSGAHAVNLIVNYIGDYDDDENANENINSQTTVDLQYSHKFRLMEKSHQTELIIGAKNLFDNDPPFVQTNFGFDTRTHDPRGRILYLRLKYML